MSENDERSFHSVDRCSGQRPRRRDLDGIPITLLYGGPIDVAHEGSDVGAGIGAEFQVESVLIHIEGEDRHAASDALTVFRRDLIDEPSVARNRGALLYSLFWGRRSDGAFGGAFYCAGLLGLCGSSCMVCGSCFRAVEDRSWFMATAANTSALC